MERVGDLEIEQDLTFQGREWAVERVGWSLMALVVVAAVLGLFGSGLLSDAAATDERGLLRVEHERFARHETPTELHVEVGEEAQRMGDVRLSVSRDWLQAMQVDAITPEPDSAEAGTGTIDYVFKSASPDALEVVFHVTAEDLGRVGGAVGLGDGEPARFSQFVFP